MIEDKTEFSLNGDDADKAYKFTDLVIKTNDYSDHNQNNPERIWDQIFNGKLGEIAVANIHKELGFEVEGPDFKVYKKNAKSWAPDLRIGEDSVSVKAHWDHKLPATSWVYSWDTTREHGRKDRELRNRNGLNIYVVITGYFFGYYQGYIYPPFRTHQLIFRQPFNPRLWDLKACVLECELPGYKYELGIKLPPIREIIRWD